MRFYYQILSLASGETCPSLLLFFDKKRYLFNAGDGVQRLCHEHKVSLNKISDIFLTSLHPDSVGGLPGLMLTMIQASTQRRRIHGPPGLSAYIQAASWFMWNQCFDIIEYTNTDFTFEQYTQTRGREFRDECVRVKIVPMNDAAVAVPIVHDRTFDFAPVEDLLTRQKPTAIGNPETGICYIIEGPRVPGSFLKDKAKELGVKGAMFTRLSKGETVEIDGRVITAADVQEPATPPSVFAVLHITGKSLLPHLDFLVNELSYYLTSNFTFCSIVHMSPVEILLDPRYVEMVNLMPRLMTQVVLNETSAGALLTQNLVYAAQGASIIKARLNALFPKLSRTPQRFWRESATAEFAALTQGWPVQCIAPEYMWKYILSPARQRGPDCTSVLLPSQPLDPWPSPVPISERKGDSPAYRELVNLETPGADPLLVFLGTASMMPGTYRNVSGIYLGMWGGGLLLDCGEGAYGQLLLNFGAEEIIGVLADLRAVVITHMHADHILGLPKLIIERGKVTNSPLLVIAPIFLEPYLQTLGMLAGPFLYTFVSATSSEVLMIPGLAAVTLVPVDHVPHSYGVVLEHESGWKLVYSGDTRPCPGLIAAGLNATVLIHEATFDDSLLEDAIAKHHSTIGEALQVAHDMNVWKLVLTHFSQRYRAPPQAKDIEVILALDHLNLHFSDLDFASSYSLSLASIFMEVMETDTEKETA